MSIREITAFDIGEVMTSRGYRGIRMGTMTRYVRGERREGGFYQLHVRPDGAWVGVDLSVEMFLTSVENSAVVTLHETHLASMDAFETWLHKAEKVLGAAIRDVTKRALAGD